MRVLAIVCALFLTLRSGAAVFADTMVIQNLSRGSESVKENLRLGQGFNSLGGLGYSQDAANCMSVTPVRTFTGDQSDEISILIDNVSSQSEFVRTASKNLSAEARYAPLGEAAEKVSRFSASVQGKRTELSSLRYDERYNYLYIEIRRMFESQTMQSFEVSPSTLTYFAERPHDFFGKCGDRFISGFRKGAEVIGILQCTAKSAKEKHRLDQSLKAQAGYKGISAQGEVSSMIEMVKKSSNNDCRLRVAAQGGVSNFFLADADKFLLNAFEYIKSAEPKTAKPLEYVTTSYKAVINREFSANVLDKIDLNLAAQREFLSRVNSELEYVGKIYDFASEQGLKFQDTRLQAERTLDDLERKKSNCILNAHDTLACKDSSSGVNLPRGHVLHPTRGSSL